MPFDGTGPKVDLDIENVIEPYRNAFQPDVLKFPANKEAEDKFILPQGIKTFTRIWDSIPLLELKRDSKGRLRPATKVFKFSPDFYYKNYILFSACLDTLGGHFHEAAHHLRQRTPIFPHLPAQYAYGSSQVNIKSAFSAAQKSPIRLEVERHVAGPLASGVPSFLEDVQRDPQLQSLGALTNLTPEVVADIGVHSTFTTSRGAFVTGIYCEEQDATVLGENCTDYYTINTPLLGALGGDAEFERESRFAAVFLKDNTVISLRNNPQDSSHFTQGLHYAAARIMEDHFGRGHFTGEFIPARDSKQERAIKLNREFYNEVLALGQEDYPLPGLACGITMRNYDHEMRNAVLNCAQRMPSARDFISDSSDVVKRHFVHEHETRTSVPALRRA